MRIKNLVEAEVKPGERKGISLKIAKLEKMLKKINDYQETASSMHSMKVPDSVAGEYEKVKQGIYDEIEKLSLEKDQFKGEKNNLPTKFYNLMQGIAKNCTQIIQAYTELNPDFKANKAVVFYRGIKSNEDALYGKPFDERRVMTSSSKLSDLFNSSMAAAGFEARRDNTSFVSSDKNQASGYGKLYVMFPKDGFKFSWSRNTKDLILDRSSYSKMVDYEKLIPLKDAILKNREKLNSYEYDFAFSDLLGDWNLDRTLEAAKRAIGNGLLPKDLEPLTDIENIVTPESLVKGFELDQEDLLGAIKSEKEVYVRGAYYAVQESYMKEIMKFLELQAYPEGKPKKTTPGQYEIGDRVTIKNKGNNYYGQSGEVTYVYETYSEVSVQLDGENWTNDFKFKDVKHEGAEDDYEYKEKDRVEVIDQDNEYFGKQGTVSDIFGSGKIEVYLQGGAYSSFQPHQIKLVSAEEPASKQLKIGDVKLGDKVKISDTHSEMYGGLEGVITEIVPDKDDPDGGWVDVRTDGDTIEVGIAEIEKITTASKPAAEPAAYEVTEPGLTSFDMGQFLTQTEYDQAIKNYGDDTFTVKKLGDDEPDVDSPDFNQVNLDWEPEPEVAKPASSKLKSGDKVKVTGKHYGGHTGTVDEVNKIGTVKVTLDTTGVPSIFYANELEVIESNPTPEFKIGDTVKVAKGPDAGKTGKLDHISNYFDEASIKLPDGTMLYDVPLEAIEHAAEPEQEPAKPTQPEIDIENYTVGKPVKVTKGEHAGKVGTLDYVSKVLANADIMTPHGSMLNNIPLADLQVLDFPVKGAAPVNPEPSQEVDFKKDPKIKALINKALMGDKQVSYTELDDAMPATNDLSSQQIEDLIAYFEQFGITIYQDF